MSLRSICPICLIAAIIIQSLAFSFTASAALRLEGPYPRAVYQRDADNQARVPIEGIISNAVATRIEARIMPMDGVTGTDWMVVDDAIDGNAFSGFLTAPAGGWYTVEIRSFNGDDMVDTESIERVGVGEVFITAGQSNSANFGNPPQTPQDDRISALSFDRPGRGGGRDGDASPWRHAVDPQPIANGSGGSPWPAAGDALAAYYDVPIGFISVGVGGTSVTQWQPGGTLYPRIAQALEAVAPNGARAILWHQGESDSIASTSAEQYAELLNNVISESREDAGYDIPWGVAIASFHPDSNETQEAAIVAGEEMVIDGDPLVFRGAFTDDFHSRGLLSDTVHFNAEGLQLHGQRWAEAVIREFPVPEPGTALVLGPMLMVVGMRRRRKQEG